MSTNENNEGLRVRSGNVVSGSRLAAFLYDLIRDQVPPGIIEEIVRKLPKPGEGDTPRPNGRAEPPKDAAPPHSDEEIPF